jgi:hypothetical protein
MAQRLPRTLLGGRVRTSTVGLAVAFAVVLTVYLLVRPAPVATVSVTNPDGSTSLYLSPSVTPPPPATTAAPSDPRTTTPGTTAAPTTAAAPTTTG